jgi:surface polysaccharide O-acyltransferase-like enzyme
MTPKRVYLQELDAVKGLAIAGVVMIHLTSLAITGPRGTGQTLAALCNQLARFSVPAFILLAGVLLSHGRFSSARFSYGTFLLRRARTLAIPYLIWTALSLALMPLTFKNVILTVLLGKGFFHQLYFVPLIFQLYMLSPLFLGATGTAARSRFWSFALVSFTCLVILLFELAGMGYLTLPTSIAKYLDLLSQVGSPAWFGYFALGCTIGQHYERVKDSVKRIPWLLALVVIGVLCVGMWWDFTTAVGIAGRVTNLAAGFARPIVFLYSLAVVFCLVKWFMAHPSRLAISMGQHSFGIYLVHLAVQESMLSLVPDLTRTWLGMMIGFVLIFGVAFLLSAIASRIPYGWVLFGETPAAKFRKAISYAPA